MGRMYVASGTATAISSAANLFQMTTDDDSVVLIHRIALRAGTIIDEQTGVKMERVSTPAGSPSTTITASPLDPGDSSFSGTILNKPTNGSGATELGRWNMSTLAGLEIIYTPEERPVLSGAAPNLLIGTEDSITSADVEWMVVFEEIG